MTATAPPQTAYALYGVPRLGQSQLLNSRVEIATLGSDGYLLGRCMDAVEHRVTVHQDPPPCILVIDGAKESRSLAYLAMHSLQTMSFHDVTLPFCFDLRRPRYEKLKHQAIPYRHSDYASTFPVPNHVDTNLLKARYEALLQAVRKLRASSKFSGLLSLIKSYDQHRFVEQREDSLLVLWRGIESFLNPGAKHQGSISRRMAIGAALHFGRKASFVRTMNDFLSRYKDRSKAAHGKSVSQPTQAIASSYKLAQELLAHSVKSQSIVERSDWDFLVESMVDL